MPSISNKKLLSQFIERVWNQEQLDAVPKYVAARYTVFHDPGDPWDGQTLDIAGFITRLTQSRAAAPDQKFEFDDMIGEDEKVVAAWRWCGTHLGSIAGILPTGKMIQMSGLTVYYFKDQKLIGHWQVADRLGVYRQIAG